VSGCSRRTPRLLVHPVPEVVPPLSGDRIRLGDLTGRLLEHVQEDEQALRPAVEDPEEPPAVVATQLAQVALDLAGMGKR
jgi:hypothetical protein